MKLQGKGTHEQANSRSERVPRKHTKEKQGQRKKTWEGGALTCLWLWAATRGRRYRPEPRRSLGLLPLRRAARTRPTSSRTRHRRDAEKKRGENGTDTRGLGVWWVRKQALVAGQYRWLAHWRTDAQGRTELTEVPRCLPGEKGKESAQQGFFSFFFLPVSWARPKRGKPLARNHTQKRQCKAKRGRCKLRCFGSNVWTVGAVWASLGSGGRPFSGGLPSCSKTA
jgi:hypothetical protein